ncbi:MAG: DUF6550 family protein [Hydrogenoanaerobacterium sp.]
MKIKTKMAIATTAIAFTSLMIMAYHIEPTTSPVSPQIASVSEVVEVGRATAPLTEIEPIVAKEITEIETQTEEIIKSTPAEISPPQPTDNAQSTTTTTAPTQTATKATVPETTAPKNGDTRTVNGQKQGYLIGFGWVDYMGENECIFEEGMHENGNKVGIMGGATVGRDGDINKQVGIMD